MTERYEHAGGCHCGNLRYRFSTPNTPQDWPVRRCTCTYCTRFGACYTSGPDTRLDVRAHDSDAVSRYEFGTRTAEFFHCGVCGVMLFASCEIDGQRYAVLNINTLDDAEALQLTSTDMDFDGEQTTDRLARRQRNWIADVRLGNL